MTAPGTGRAAPPALDPAPRILLVVAPYYRALADAQIAGAAAVLDAAGAERETVEVPGALEIPTAISLARETGRYEGYVALGCVIRGETTHYETVCQESARGLTLLGIRHGLAIGNGILTVETLAQAEARADPARLDKGGDAAAAALKLVALARRFGRMPPGADPGVPGGDEFLLAGAAQQPRTA
jgi:6,7-dimethyl-8-ribityllumazine synthase